MQFSVFQPSLKPTEVDENGELKIFHCNQCPASFSRRQQLLGHASEHKEKTRGMKCSYCQKWFPSNSTLKRHVRIHTGNQKLLIENLLMLRACN